MAVLIRTQWWAHLHFVELVSSSPDSSLDERKLVLPDKYINKMSGELMLTSACMSLKNVVLPRTADSVVAREHQAAFAAQCALGSTCSYAPVYVAKRVAAMMLSAMGGGGGGGGGGGVTYLCTLGRFHTVRYMAAILVIHETSRVPLCNTCTCFVASTCTL